MVASVLNRFNDAIADLVEGLGDPARRRKAALVFCAGYAVLWFIYGVIAKSSQDLNADMAEMVVWTREPALGYSKHPPLLAWILWAWFNVFPLADWAYILLAVVTIAIGIFLAIELCAEWLDGEKLAAVPFLLSLVPFYNFLGLKWDQNSILIPLWALAMWAMLRALNTRHDGWAALTGLAAAAAMLSKYWSLFLIAAMSLAVVLHDRRVAYFRSRAPWVTAIVFLLALAPHVWWLIANDFPPIRWVSTRRISESFGDTVKSTFEYLGGTLGYAAGAILLVLIFVRPSRRAVADSLAPRDERRTAAALFWVPILLPILPALAKNISLISLWNTPAYNLLPVMLLGSPRVVLKRVALQQIARVAVAFSIIVALLSPVIAYVIHKRGVENDAAYARLVMREAERDWRAVSDKPLKMIAGPFVLVSSASFYGSDQPSTFADFSPYLSPWATPERVARDGMVVMVAHGSPWFDDTLRRLEAYPVASRREVTLTRRWLWFDNAPRRFIIATVLPQ